MEIFQPGSPAHRGEEITRLRDRRPGASPSWSMYWPMLLWQQYPFSGDETLLREMSPRLTHFLEWLKAYQDPTNKLLNPPGWRISEYAGGNLPGGGYNIATTCQYYEDLWIAARVFSELGQTNQSIEYSPAGGGSQSRHQHSSLQWPILSGAYRPEGNVSTRFCMGVAL